MMTDLLNLHMSVCLVDKVPLSSPAYSSVSAFLSLIPHGTRIWSFSSTISRIGGLFYFPSKAQKQNIFKFTMSLQCLQCLYNVTTISNIWIIRRHQLITKDKMFSHRYKFSQIATKKAYVKQ